MESTGNPERYLPLEVTDRIDALLARRRHQDAASIVRSAILKIERVGGDEPSQRMPPEPGGPPSAPGPAGPDPQAIERFVSVEKRSPTTSKNVRRRFQALMDVMEPAAKPGKYRNATAMRIGSLLDQGRFQQAATLLHSVILDLKKAVKGGPPPARQPVEPGSIRTLERLVAQEKESPTTENNFEMRRGALYQALIDTRDPLRYVPPDAGEFVQNLIGQGRRAEAAAKLREIILSIRFETPPPSQDAGPRKTESPVPNQTSAPADADKAGAATLYFKAMQDYAEGKLDHAVSLLESGAKLDPDNQDIAKALERLRKER